MDTIVSTHRIRVSWHFFRMRFWTAWNPYGKQNQDSTPFVILCKCSMVKENYITPSLVVWGVWIIVLQLILILSLIAYSLSINHSNIRTRIFKHHARTGTLSSCVVSISWTSWNHALDMSDPEERHDVSSSSWCCETSYREQMRSLRIDHLKKSIGWRSIVMWCGPAHVRGDCDMNPYVCSLVVEYHNSHLTLPQHRYIKDKEHCVFAHPWIPDDVDLNSVELVFGASAVPFVTKVMLRIWDVYLKPVFFVLAVVWILPKLVLRRML